MKIRIPVITCQRCGYKWTPRTGDVRICPKCKSPRFDVPRSRKQGKDHA